MPRTREQIEQAAADAEAWLDGLDPEVTPAEDAADLRRIGLALGLVASAEQQLADAIRDARTNGRTWADIGLTLGVSRQAAQERFGSSTDETPRRKRRRTATGRSALTGRFVAGAAASRSGSKEKAEGEASSIESPAR